MHEPVLLQSTIESLDLKVGQTVLDATLGLGGHASLICEKIGEPGLFIGLDQDRETLELAKQKLTTYPTRTIFKLSNFRHLAKVLDEENIEEIDAVLFDLGFSSRQMDASGRGFTFQKDEPLLMTLSTELNAETLTAEEIVNNWQEDSLTDIIFGFGEEKFSRRIAKAIVEARTAKPIKTTFDLVAIIKSAVPVWYQKGRKIHFATKTFQALRMTVNEELAVLDEGLAGAWQKLKPDGRLAVISFHSLEARKIKQFMQEKVKADVGEMVNKKVIKPDRGEQVANPRSRSAQLRVIKKIKAE